MKARKLVKERKDAIDGARFRNAPNKTKDVTKKISCSVLFKVFFLGMGVLFVQRLSQQPIPKDDLLPTSTRGGGGVIAERQTTKSFENAGTTTTTMTTTTNLRAAVFPKSSATLPARD